MNLRQVSDDFFTIGNIAVLQCNTGNDVYDFDFRNHFECKSVLKEIEDPILLHIGAVEDYAGIEDMVEQMGMKLLVHEAEHLRCSTIEGWYPVLKDKTPYTKVFDELPPVEEILKDFTFPVFIKGNRQTNRHKKSQCIIEDEKAYETLRNEWKNDPILSWQKVAVREYIQLQTIDATSYPDMVPISYEFRFFYFEGKCMAYGPYWYMGHQYTLDAEELAEVLKLTDWAAEKLAVIFPSIDVAKTASGEWIIIEVNDAQESGFVGVNPITLWNNTIDAAQNRTWISVEDLFEEETVIMGGDPAPNITIEEMRVLAEQASTEREISDAFAAASNKAWWVEDNEYDYEEGTEEHKQACRITDDWFEVSDILKEKIFDILRGEGVSIPEKGQIAVLSPFMARNGYRDCNGWWVKISE